jgi:hypothetical protein
MTRDEPIQEVVTPRLPLQAQQETLVNDSRAGLTPSQMVEQKLVSILRSTILPTSHLQVSRIRRALS